MAIQDEKSTCDQILRLIVERGPITAGELAKILVLTPAAVRRHIATLVEDEHIQEHEMPAMGPARRGRPSRNYVATPAGQAQLAEGYSELANSALNFVSETLGEEGITQFIEARVSGLEQKYRAAVEAAGEAPADRAVALAEVLNRDGYVTILRKAGPNGMAIQLCQGHCPIQNVAEEFPQLCEAETQAFGRLLGVPIQRLATLAGGEHVCTTNIPLGYPRKTSDSVDAS